MWKINPEKDVKEQKGHFQKYILRVKFYQTNKQLNIYVKYQKQKQYLFH